MGTKETSASAAPSSNRRRPSSTVIRIMLAVTVVSRIMLAVTVVSFVTGYYAGSIQTWNPLQPNVALKDHKSDKQQVVTAKYGPVSRIALLGERNTGTSWFTEILTECFPNLDVTPGLSRSKHWFQEDDRTELRQNTIVVAMFRNSSDWTKAMRKRPHHSPNHLRLHWSEFITKPWTMPRPSRDFPYANLSGPICQEGFPYRQIVACLRPLEKSLDHVKSKDTNFSGWDPQYEHRFDGTPYDSILDLRADKIRNLLEIEGWDWVSDFRVLRYEELLREGTGDFIKSIEKSAGHKAQCSPIPPSPERLNAYKHKRNFVEIMDNMVDWDAEALIGYHPAVLGDPALWPARNCTINVVDNY